MLGDFLKKMGKGTDEPELHMRHVFQLAVYVEAKGAEFYTKLAEKAVSPAVKDLCERLAQDELEHKNVFTAKLMSWKQLPEDIRPPEKLMREFAGFKMFTGVDVNAMEEKELIEYAIRQEEKSFAFYSRMRLHFPSAWKQMHIEELMLAERTHKTELEALLARF